MPARSTTPVEAAPRPAPDLAPVRGHRRPWLLGLGVLLTVMGALAVVWLVGAAGQRQEVVVVAREVDYGQPIDASDLGVARVSVDPGVEVVPASERTGLVGQVASTRLAPGMLLGSSMVEPAGEPGPGSVLVPMAVPAERMPAGGLRAGDRLLVVDSEAGGAGGPVAARVVRVGPPDVNGVSVVDVTTTAAAGPQLAVSAANGRVALVVQPAGGR